MQYHHHHEDDPQDMDDRHAVDDRLLRQSRQVRLIRQIDDEDDALMTEIREKAEKTKMSLSNIENARQILTINGKNYRIEITRDEFEEETKTLMERTEILLNEVLSAKDVSWTEIDEVLLVGGSTRMVVSSEL